MFSFVAKLVVSPGKTAAFERLQIELKALTHKHEPDAPVYEVLRSQDDPLTYLVVATFKDKAAFELHQNIDFHHRLVPPILDCLSGEMELSFYESIS